MNYFYKGVGQVIALFVLCMIFDLLITAYIQTEEYIRQWLVIGTRLFIIELFVISNSLKIRKVLILNFGILPNHSDDPYSALYKENQKKAWPECGKVKFPYLLVMSFFISFWIQSFLIEFDFFKIKTYFTLIQSTSLVSVIILFFMIIVSLLFVELVIMIYLWIFVKTLNHKQFPR